MKFNETLLERVKVLKSRGPGFNVEPNAKPGYSPPSAVSPPSPRVGRKQGGWARG